MPNGPRIVRQWREKFNHMAEEKGRDPGSIEIDVLATGNVTRDLIDEFAEASVQRLAISLDPMNTLEEGYANLEAIARKVL